MIHRSPFPVVTIPEVPLHDYVLAEAADRADQPALIDGPTGRTWTFGQLLGGARRLAGGLAARGLKSGEVVAIFSPNVPEYAVVFFGVAMAGGVNTTVNPLYTADELANQLHDAGAKFLVTIPQFLETAREAAERAGIAEIFVIGEADGATPLRALLAHDYPAPEVHFNPRDDLVVLPYSSGTTGLPKGVMLTHFNLVANLAQCEAIEHIQPGTRTVGILPFYHIYGMVVILCMALRKGATVVTMPRFDLEQFLQLLQDHEMDNLYVVPPIILALAKHPLVDRFDLSKVATITSGAAPLPEAVAVGCAERLGCVVKQGYGMTELSPVSHMMPRQQGIKPDSVGFGVPNTEFRIVEIGTAKDTAPGETGELWIRGPQVMKGYLNNPDATTHIIDAEGWLHTGDVARVDRDGHVYIVDRVKELIKYKGFQVAPAELEAVVQAHPAVADAAVIPSPDHEAGEVPKALVVLKPGQDTTAEVIMSFVAERVAPHKKIRKLDFVDSIPKTASGKILRRDLIERERKALNG